MSDLDPGQLVAHQGRRMRLTFLDGQDVVGAIVGVYTEDDQFTYRLVKILRAGPITIPELQPGSIVSARLSDLQTVQRWEGVRPNRDES